MSARREASQPPVIPGYEYVRLLGTGGFADVFLYRQQMPRRRVAVKVLLAASLDDEARARFRAEADIMASLSHHPSIVTVYQADVAADGRPYLVMEYCSRPGLAQRYRAERMGVAEVLRIGDPAQPRRSRPRTAPASCTGTSSRRTCWSPTSGGRR